MMPSRVFSPDGSQIVFTRCETVGEFVCPLYRIQADGTGLTAITHVSPSHHINDWNAAYSQDGATIAFERYAWDVTGLLEAIYLMNSDGSGIHSIAPPKERLTRPALASPGARLLFHDSPRACRSPDQAPSRPYSRCVGCPAFIDSSDQLLA
jgi:hypothetical protein